MKGWRRRRRKYLRPDTSAEYVRRGGETGRGSVRREAERESGAWENARSHASCRRAKRSPALSSPLPPSELLTESRLITRSGQRRRKGSVVAAGRRSVSPALALSLPPPPLVRPSLSLSLSLPFTASESADYSRTSKPMRFFFRLASKG